MTKTPKRTVYPNAKAAAAGTKSAVRRGELTRQEGDRAIKALGKALGKKK